MSGKVKLAVKNIEKFDGSMEFDLWYRDFQATVDALLLDDAERYTALVLALDTDVVTRIMAECKEAGTLPEPQQRSARWLKEELDTRFAFDRTVLKRLQELMQRRKERDETLEGYFIVKRQLYLQWAELMIDEKNARAPWLDSSRLFWEMAIDGLPKSLQPAVKTLHPADRERKFTELVKTVRSLQSSEPRPTATPAVKPPTPKKAEKTKELKKGEVCFHCGESGHFKYQCPKWREEKKRRSDKKQGKEGGKERKEAVHVVRRAPELDKKFVAARLAHNGREENVLALVDTGADVSVLAKEVAAKLAATARWETTSSGGTPLETANGTHLKVVGKLNVAVKLADGAEIATDLAVSELTHPMLLGRDLLKRLNAKVDVASGTIEMPEVTLEMVDDDEPERDADDDVPELYDSDDESAERTAKEKAPSGLAKEGRAGDNSGEAQRATPKELVLVLEDHEETIDMKPSKLGARGKMRGLSISTRHQVMTVEEPKQMTRSCEAITAKEATGAEKASQVDKLAKAKRVKMKTGSSFINRAKMLAQDVNYDDGEVKAERLLGFPARLAPAWKLLERRGSDADSL